MANSCNAITQKADLELVMSSRAGWASQDSNNKILSKKVDRQTDNK